LLLRVPFNIQMNEPYGADRKSISKTKVQPAASAAMMSDFNAPMAFGRLALVLSTYIPEPEICPASKPPPAVTVSGPSPKTAATALVAPPA
jgi:hypothetical protein